MKQEEKINEAKTPPGTLLVWMCQGTMHFARVGVRATISDKSAMGSTICFLELHPSGRISEHDDVWIRNPWAHEVYLPGTPGFNQVEVFLAAAALGVVNKDLLPSACKEYLQ